MFDHYTFKNKIKPTQTGWWDSITYTMKMLNLYYKAITKLILKLSNTNSRTNLKTLLLIVNMNPNTYFIKPLI